jgi:signal transduction histidine kinase
MKIALITILFWVSFNTTTNAQQNFRDSIFNIVKAAKADTQTVKALYEYGDIMQDEAPDSAIIYFTEAYNLSKQLNYIKGIGDFYRSVTFHYGIREGNTAKGLEYAHEFMAFAKQHNTPELFSKAYFAYAAIYQYKQIPDSAIYFYENCIPYTLQTGKKINTIVIYNNLASLYHNLELADKSIEYSTKALQLGITLNDTLSLISAYQSLSNANILKKDTTAVLNYIIKAYQLATITKNKFATLTAAYNLSETYKDMGLLDSTFKYLNIANIIAVSFESYPEISTISMGLADYYVAKKEWGKAVGYIRLAIKDTAKFEMPLSKKMEWYKILSKVQNGMGNYKAATQSLNTYINLYNEEILRVKTEKNLAFDERLKKAEQAKELLQNEIKIKKQQTLITGLALGFAALMGTGLFFILYQKNKQALKNKQLESLKIENEFIAVKSSLEGQLTERSRISKEIHDELGSSLTSISLLTEVLKKRLDVNQNPEVNKIGETSADMVDKMNEIIWALNTSNDTINSLVAYTRKFANNFLHDAAIELQFEEDMPLQQLQVEGTTRRNIYLTVKEAINNIVKHSGATKVKIEIQAVEALNISIQDNGKGFDADKQPGFRNGLLNMQKRMEDIGGRFSIKNNNGTLIELFYPLKIS